MAGNSSLKLVHIRHSMDDYATFGTLALDEVYARKAEEDRRYRFRFPGRPRLRRRINPTNLDGQEEPQYVEEPEEEQLPEPKRESPCGCIREPMMQDFREFAEWVFGPRGLLNLDFVVYGDFYTKGQLTKQNVVAYRVPEGDSEDARRGFATLQCPHTIWECRGLWPYLDFLQQCPSAGAV